MTIDQCPHCLVSLNEAWYEHVYKPFRFPQEWGCSCSFCHSYERSFHFSPRSLPTATSSHNNGQVNIRCHCRSSNWWYVYSKQCYWYCARTTWMLSLYEETEAETETNPPLSHMTASSYLGRNVWTVIGRDDESVSNLDDGISFFRWFLLIHLIVGPHIATTAGTIEVYDLASLSHQGFIT